MTATLRVIVPAPEARPSNDLWRCRAACRTAPPGLFITAGDADDDPKYPPDEAKSYCNLCPVSSDCLKDALDHTTPTQRVIGIWGGLTEYQREQLLRRRQRAKCPGCGNDDKIVREATRELCLACGVSWLS
jgi:WhiB family redox-sensing transcriptional regulator